MILRSITGRDQKPGVQWKNHEFDLQFLCSAAVTASCLVRWWCHHNEMNLHFLRPSIHPLQTALIYDPVQSWLASAQQGDMGICEVYVKLFVIVWIWVSNDCFSYICFSTWKEMRNDHEIMGHREGDRPDCERSKPLWNAGELLPGYEAQKSKEHDIF